MLSIEMTSLPDSFVRPIKSLSPHSSEKKHFSPSTKNQRCVVSLSNATTTFGVDGSMFHFYWDAFAELGKKEKGREDVGE
jgi:hypothetical protein